GSERAPGGRPAPGQIHFWADGPGRRRGDVSEDRQYHVGLAAGEVGQYVLVPGDPFRTALIARHLEDAQERAWSREFRTFTGRVGDTLVSTCSSGIGGPSMAIAVEELGELGVHTFVRV